MSSLIDELSLSRVPLKHFNEDDVAATSKSLTPLPIKGVHFCPVVSEVSWKESYSEDEQEEEEEEEEEDSDEEEESDEEEVTPTTVSSDHVMVDEVCGVASVAHIPLVELHAQTMSNKKPHHSGRFGGFFQRFSFRRRNDPAKASASTSSKKPKIDVVPAYEDVTIISLHPPPPSVATPLVAKPPPCPPRGVATPASRRPPVLLGVLQRQAGAAGSSSSMTDSVGIDRTTQRGLLETDLDAEEKDEEEDGRRRYQHVYQQHQPKKARSLLNLGMNHGLVLHQPMTMLKPPSGASVGPAGGGQDARAKSMEFLLDKENHAAVQPPENELQKGGATDRVMSEHQLRVQRSLQKLNVPDWYKNSSVARGHEGFLLRKDPVTEATHQGWPGLGSKTTSLSSLGSTQSAAARSPTSHLLSPSPIPSPHVFTRWSTSRLNSGGTSASTSPCNSTRSSFNYRQPYLGWRSQERLSRPPRTPAERLAAGILPAQQAPIQSQQQVPNLSEVRTSIKEVTSAIVHYVSGVRDGSGDICPAAEDSPTNRSPRWDRESLSPRDQWTNVSRSSSPRGSGRLCWLESSFVGSRPTETPETPLTLTNDRTLTSDQLYLELNNQRYNNARQVNGEYLLT